MKIFIFISEAQPNLLKQADELTGKRTDKINVIKTIKDKGLLIF